MKKTEIIIFNRKNFNLKNHNLFNIRIISLESIYYFSKILDEQIDYIRLEVLIDGVIYRFNKVCDTFRGVFRGISVIIEDCGFNEKISTRIKYLSYKFYEKETKYNFKPTFIL